MGWARYEVDGRPCGYSVEAECDRKGCAARINRGLGYLCGDMPGGDGGCGGYFCPDHAYDHECEADR